MDGQDWETVVLRKPPSSVKKDSNGVNVPAKKLTAEQIRLNKLENEELVEKKISLEVRKVIQQARQAKNMSQSQLAQQLNVKPNVINEYESGKVVPNNQLLGKMERILKVKLRGKDIGKKH